MKQFTKDLLSSSNKASSKRTLGILMILYYLIVLTLTLFGVEFSEQSISMVTSLLYAGTGLLGVGMFDRYGSNNEIKDW